MIIPNAPLIVVDSLSAWQVVITNSAMKWLVGLSAPAAVLWGVGWAIFNPAKVHQAVTFVLRWLVKLTGMAKRTHAAYSVADQVNGYLRQQVFARIADVRAQSIAIEWVEQNAEAREGKDGGFIVRMRHEVDAERNALVALTACVPKLFVPHLWPLLSKRMRTAFELHIVGVMARSLGGRALSIYNTEMLTPKLDADAELQSLLDRLEDVQAAGFFEAILLQELMELSDRALMRPPRDAGADVDRFVTWLHALATRTPRDDTTLEFPSANLPVAAILAARFDTAAMGTAPYQRRMKRNLLRGIRNVYLIGLTRAHRAFTMRIADAIENDGWARQIKVADAIRRADQGNDELRVVLFRRDDLRLSGKTFTDLAKEAGVLVGAEVEGVVRDIADEFVMIRIAELDVEVPRDELAWGFRGHPGWLVGEGDSLKVKVQSIHDGMCAIKASARACTLSPWNITPPPTSGQVHRVEVLNWFDGGDIIVRLLDVPVGSNVYGFIPRENWSWYPENAPQFMIPEHGKVLKVILRRTSAKHDELELSAAAREPRDWETISSRYPDGQQIRVLVIGVDYDGLRCEVEPGAFGRIERERLIEAGFEYADFQRTVVPGSRLDVVVIGRRPSKQFLKLDLARNIARRSSGGPTRLGGR